MPREVTDPDLLAKLNASSGPREVTEPAILAVLNKTDRGLFGKASDIISQQAAEESNPTVREQNAAGDTLVTQGLPVIGAAVPSTSAMKELSETNPAVAGGLRTVGSVAGSIPAFAAAPGVVGAMGAGGALNAADTLARGGTASDAAKSAAIGATGGALASAPAALLTKSATGVAPAVMSKSQAMLKALSPGGETSAVALEAPAARVARQLPDRLDKILSVAGSTVGAGALGHHIHPGIGEALALAGYGGSHEAGPFINAILRALAPSAAKIPAAVNPVVSDLSRMYAPEGGVQP